MKCKKYKVSVTEGILDHVHGAYETIEEIYVPEPYNICINEKGYAFKATGPRADNKKKMKNVNVPEDAIKQIDRWVSWKEKGEKIVKDIFTGEYEERELVELDLDFETIHKITILADEENMTFSEKINDILEKSMKEYEKNPDKFIKQMEKLNG